jgi:predicted Zn-dependent protease
MPRFQSLVLVIPLLGACATNPVTGQQDLVFMSEQQEIAIGRQNHAEIVKFFGVYEDPALQDYVQRIGERLAAASHRPDLVYRFTVLDSKEVNAFALPGGYIYITRGLLAYLNDEADLAAVLGHEIGHVTARHAVRQHSAVQLANIGATLGTIFIPGMAHPAAGQLVNVLGTALLRGYGREHELEADRLGAVYLARSGYDPDAILDALRLLKNQEQLELELARAEGREPRSYHGIFATHPDNDTRLQEVVGTAAALRTPGEPFVGREEFLRLIDGLVYGDGQREGVLRGDNFYHAELGFALKLPRGWIIENRPEVLIAKAPGGAAVLQLMAEDLGKRIPPGEYLVQRLRLSGVSDSRPLTIHGLPAHTLIAPVPTEHGRRPARLTAIYFRDKAYVIAGVSRDSARAGEFDAEFLATMQSFHELTPTERKLAEPLRLSIVPAAGETYADLARQSPLQQFQELHLRLLNGDYPAGEPMAGELLKLVQ